MDVSKIQGPGDGGAVSDSKALFEAWAIQDGTYDLRPAKWKVLSVRGVPYEGYVRPYLQDRTVYAYEGFCAALTMYGAERAK